VSGNTGDQTVLFEAALNGKAVLTSDDAQIWDICSVMSKQLNYHLFCQRVYKNTRIKTKGVVVPVNAVGSIKDGVFIEDGSTARLRVETSEAFALEGNLEGQRVGLNFSSTDNLVGRDQLEFSLGNDRSRKAGQNHALRKSCKVGIYSFINIES
jgi:hypothetical protein